MSLCSDCPPVGYITDKTRCALCPRRRVTHLHSDTDNFEEVMMCGLFGFDEGNGVFAVTLTSNKLMFTRDEKACTCKNCLRVLETVKRKW